MVDVTYNVKKQEDGWYLATADLGRDSGGSIIVEGQTFAELRRRVVEMTTHHLSVCRREGVRVPENQRIRLKHSEMLFQKPGSERVLLVGRFITGHYGVSHEGLGIELYHEDLDALRENLIEELRKKGASDKNIELTLEEVLELSTVET